MKKKKKLEIHDIENLTEEEKEVLNIQESEIGIFFDIPDELVEEWNMTEEEVITMCEDASRKGLMHIYDIVNKSKKIPDVYS